LIDEQKLRQGLQRLLEGTTTAIRERLADEPSLEAKLRERHAAAVQAERTEGSQKGYAAFAEDAITQAAAHWLLGCVFVRFLEDNGWLDERNSRVAWISGPAERLAIAKDRRTLFLRPDPGLTDRDYLLHVFAEVAKLPGVAGLFDPKHNPLFSLQPTAQGAARIVEFFQQVDPDANQLIHDFADPTHGTRFLGDLYQNLSESARKRYALCQTPGFVIDFILDRTLTPALDAFGLENFRMIDPSCGSGHFLLEAFARLIRAWENKEPGTNMPALVQRALDAVYGVDLNPFAIEITRFRLLISALESSGIRRLKEAPNFKFNPAAGDSLLHGSRLAGGGIQRGLLEDRMEHFYDTEDAQELNRILTQPYHVVVGNPPYINVSDPVLREAYRRRFETCHGKYQLGVPFTERFIDLTLRGNSQSNVPSGWMGMIVSNAFMKRSFGKKLVESYLRHLDLTHVIDTSGVYLPWHGTPTAILLARHRQPVSETIRAVRGTKGETGIPEQPSNAPVWREIADNVDRDLFEGNHVSVSNVPRESFARHPWSVGGGGAAELKELIESNAGVVLGELASSIGIVSFTLEDDLYQLDEATVARLRIPSHLTRPLVAGELVRDWMTQRTDRVNIFPYDELLHPLSELCLPLLRFMWPARTSISRNMMFGGKTKLQAGLRWYEYGRLTAHKLQTPLSIVVAFVATHNNFSIDRGGMIFNQTAPVIKLSSDANEGEHLGILGLLNSSTACFWLKQICYPKGGDHIGDQGARVTRFLWEERYEFDGTKLKAFPIAGQKPNDLAHLLQREADACSAVLPDKLFANATPSRAKLDDAQSQVRKHIARMISLQEELDWQCYFLYGLIEEEITIAPEQAPPLALGERAFEIMLARSGDEPAWFERHQSRPIIEQPPEWTDAYRNIVDRRMALIETNRDLALLERPEFKRRWNIPKWKEMESVAIKGWLLDRIDANSVWGGHQLVSCANLRDVLAQDPNWLSVAELYSGVPLEDLEQLVVDLTTREAIPFLPVLRYTSAGLRKRVEWERVWESQRKEDLGQKVDIPMPTKYVAKDFQKSDYWRLRGALDAPKERFVLYPNLERDSDRTPVLGWAGWSYLDQARALATYYQRMRTEEGWEPERLKPILAGLLDLREWLKQWHDDLDPETGLKLGTYFSEFAEAQCQNLGFSAQEVLAWQPANTTTGRKKKSKAQ
jgi:hypothetical protein